MFQLHRRLRQDVQRGCVEGFTRHVIGASAVSGVPGSGGRRTVRYDLVKRQPGTSRLSGWHEWHKASWKYPRPHQAGSVAGVALSCTCVDGSARGRGTKSSDAAVGRPVPT